MLARAAGQFMQRPGRFFIGPAVARGVKDFKQLDMKFGITGPGGHGGTRDFLGLFELLESKIGVDLARGIFFRFLFNDCGGRLGRLRACLLLWFAGLSAGQTFSRGRRLPAVSIRTPSLVAGQVFSRGRRAGFLPGVIGGVRAQRSRAGGQDVRFSLPALAQAQQEQDQQHQQQPGADNGDQRPGGQDVLERAKIVIARPCIALLRCGTGHGFLSASGRWRGPRLGGRLRRHGLGPAELRLQGGHFAVFQRQKPLQVLDQVPVFSQPIRKFEILPLE